MIEESLQNKISENEQKIKLLIRLSKKSNTKISQKINPLEKKSKMGLMSKVQANNLDISKENKKINSFILNKENNKNLSNIVFYPILKSSNNIETNLNNVVNNDKSNSSNKSAFKKSNKQNISKIKKKYKKLERFINKKHPNISSSIGETKKVKNTSKSLSNKAETIQRNILKSKSYLYNLEYSKKFSKSFDFNLTYERFIENESKKNEKISKIKKKREKFEKKIFPHQPKINQNSKNLTKFMTDNFLMRLEKYKKEKIEKEELLKRRILKDEEEKINKNNYLILHQKLNRKRINDSFDKINNYKEIAQSVNKLFDWNKKRKEKIEKEIIKQDVFEKSLHIPKINKSKFHKDNKIIKKIYDRLYNKNKYIFEFKKNLLTQESTPKFNSLLNKTKSQSNICNYLKQIPSNDNSKDNEKINGTNDSLEIHNYEEFKILNKTDRTIFNKEIKNKNEPFPKEINPKSLIIVIRKIKSQIDIANK